MINMTFNKFTLAFVDAMFPAASQTSRTPLYNLVDDIVVDLGGDSNHPQFAVAFAQAMLGSKFTDSNNYVIPKPSNVDLLNLADILRSVGVVVPEDFIAQVRMVIVPGSIFDDDDDTDEGYDDDDDSDPFVGDDDDNENYN